MINKQGAKRMDNKTVSPEDRAHGLMERKPPSKGMADDGALLGEGYLTVPVRLFAEEKPQQEEGNAMNQTPKTAEILCVGTELLMGNTVNTNAAFLARGLAEAGLNLYHQTVVGDNPERLREAVELALSRADLVITTGGLGPPTTTSPRRPSPRPWAGSWSPTRRASGGWRNTSAAGAGLPAPTTRNSA